MPNPFRIHGTVAGSYFTNRASEMRRLAGTLAEPGAKLLVMGERRVGKTSTLLRAVGRHRRAGGHAVLVDCSTATSLAEVAGRILEAAALGMTKAGFGDLMSAFVRGVSVSLSAHTDAGTGLVVPTLEMSARRESAAAQQRTVGDVLDTLDRIAAHHGTTVGLVLDEFQEIHALGGEHAEWHLRGVMQHHQHLSYILSGSRPSLLREMLGPGRAFYQMLDVMEFGPIEAHHLGTWIDARLTGAGVRARGVGARCVAVAGPRTRDVVQLARKVYDLAAAERETRADVTTTDAAFAELVEEMDDALRAQWEDATLLQRNVPSGRRRRPRPDDRGDPRALRVAVQFIGGQGDRGPDGRAPRGEGRRGADRVCVRLPLFPWMGHPPCAPGRRDHAPDDRARRHEPLTRRGPAADPAVCDSGPRVAVPPVDPSDD